jgi:hypothetical protein
VTSIRREGVKDQKSGIPGARRRVATLKTLLNAGQPAPLIIGFAIPDKPKSTAWYRVAQTF